MRLQTKLYLLDKTKNSIIPASKLAGMADQMPSMANNSDKYGQHNVHTRLALWSCVQISTGQSRLCTASWPATGSRRLSGCPTMEPGGVVAWRPCCSLESARCKKVYKGHGTDNNILENHTRCYGSNAAAPTALSCQGPSVNGSSEANYNYSGPRTSIDVYTPCPTTPRLSEFLRFW